MNCEKRQKWLIPALKHKNKKGIHPATIDIGRSRMNPFLQRTDFIFYSLITE